MVRKDDKPVAEFPRQYYYHQLPNARVQEAYVRMVCFLVQLDSSDSTLFVRVPLDDRTIPNNSREEKTRSGHRMNRCTKPSTRDPTNFRSLLWTKQKFGKNICRWIGKIKIHRNKMHDKKEWKVMRKKTNEYNYVYSL